MTDLLLVTTLLVSFVALLGLIRVCDRIVGPDEVTSSTDDAASLDGAK